MTIASSHVGNFAPGQTGAVYTLTATNSGLGPTNGAVTVTDILPASLLAQSIGGPGWSCVQPAGPCSRNNSLNGGASYEAITLTVNVAESDPPSVTNTVEVSADGAANSVNSTSNDVTGIVSPAPSLSVSKNHSGNFTQGQMGATYSLLVTNNAAAGPTNGTVTVIDTLPAGLTATAIGGTNWSCTLGTITCTRSDVLNAGASYQAIVVTVNVAGNAPVSVTNEVSVSGGGSATANASDTTTIVSPCALTQDGSARVADVQKIINEALGSTQTLDDLNRDGVVSAVDVQIVINATLGLGCSL